MDVAPGNGERMYRLLRVSPDATAQQIRRAYRRLAHDMHPDTNPEDPEAARRFQEITEAFELLSNPESRARYDRERPQPVSAKRPADGAVAARPGAPRLAGWVVADSPTVLGGGPVPLGSMPLVAGPVRHMPHSGTADHISVTSLLGAGLIEAMWEVWWRR